MRGARSGQRWGVAIGIAALGGALFSAFVPAAAPAEAQSPTPLQVTYVARVCNSYSDIMANKARNNIQESLFNLGPDSTYAANGIVDPTAEQNGSPNCRPYTGWRFSTGSDYTGKTEASEYLSTVTGVFRSDIVTRASTPLLDAQGQPVLGPGGTPQSIAGAVTVQLNTSEAAWVQSGRLLWVEGGTPASPLNGNPDVGFGALRCAQDALNGDNVDAVTFPQARTHVFCYYYLVTPPPPPGTITIVKHVVGAQSDTFPFQGNISYNPGGAFTLTGAPGRDGSIDFVRGATLGSVSQPPWSFTEQAKDGWQPPGQASCVSETGGSVVSYSGATTSVDLAPDDHVTCTYTNTPTPLGNGELWKVSTGAVGTFPFTIAGPTSTEQFPDVTTQQPGVPIRFATRTGSPAGSYTATEQMPTDFSRTGPGTWRMTNAVCNGAATPFTNTPGANASATATYTAAPASDVSCLFVNDFDPAGSIDIFKSTEGGVGRFEYSILNNNDNLTRVQDPTAVTTTPGVEVQAQPSATGLSAAEGAQYTILESMPAPDSGGFWVMESATCGENTVSVDLAAGSVVVALSPSLANASCHFVNRYQPYGTFSVVKTTSPDTALRPDAAQIAIDCSDNAFDGTFAVAPGQGGNDSGVVQTDATMTCSVTEPETGAAADVDVATSAYIEVDGARQPYELGDTFTAALGSFTQVVVDNTLSAVTPTPTPTPTPTTPPGGGGVAPQPPTGLANTGSTAPPPWLPLAIAGSGLVGTGIVTVDTVRLRRRGTQR